MVEVTDTLAFTHLLHLFLLPTTVNIHFLDALRSDLLALKYLRYDKLHN